MVQFHRGWRIGSIVAVQPSFDLSSNRFYGIFCGTYAACSKISEPFIDFFRYMPAPAFSTLLVAIFGAHDEPKVALVFIGTFFQMVLMIATTPRQLHHRLLESAQT